MIKLGFLGVQSKHAEYFGSLFNIEQIFKDVAVTALWGGDSPDRIKHVSNMLKIDRIASAPLELINEVDAVLILLRDGNKHIKYAVEALNKGVPVFVDKPFTVKPDEARIIVDTARKSGTPLFGGSTLRHLPGIQDVKKRIENGDISHVSIRYSADPNSPFGGYYFYGSHLAEICTALCGRDFISVKASRRASEVSVIVEYPKISAILHSSPLAKGLNISLFGEGAEHFKIDESSCYCRGMEIFVSMLKTGDLPCDYEDFVYPVEMLDTIIQSF